MKTSDFAMAVLPTVEYASRWSERHANWLRKARQARLEEKRSDAAKYLDLAWFERRYGWMTATHIRAVFVAQTTTPRWDWSGLTREGTR